MEDIPTLDQWQSHLAALVSLLGEASFYERLNAAFSEIEGIGEVLLFRYPANGPPGIIYNCYAEGSSEHIRHVETYLAGPYVLDPYFEASLHGIPAGAYQLNEIAPDDFRNSEFYRVYYAATGLKDELSYIQQLEDESHLQLSVGYTGPNTAIPPDLISLLIALEPMVNALIRKQWSLQGTAPLSGPDQQFHDHLLSALALFGSSMLTPREKDTLQLILNGHSNKSAAAKLTVSEATIKLHRKHIYEKLDIGSQSQLFHLFLDSLSCFDPAEHKDPLSAYMGAP